MAVIGDSITQGVNLGRDSLGAAPEHSWAAGASDDSVRSHFERLVEADAPIGPRVFNNSVSGSTMADAPGMADAAVLQEVDYVVILVGANDVCAPTVAGMTLAADFESQFTATMQRLTTGLPDAGIYVVSIPDIHRLWELLREDLAASTVWASGGICPSMLSPLNSDSDREVARERNIEFNAILERGCGLHPQCRFDDNALFEEAFSANEVSDLDYFHPSEAGQAKIADISWERGFWPSL